MKPTATQRRAVRRQKHDERQCKRCKAPAAFRERCQRVIASPFCNRWQMATRKTL